MRSVLIIEPSEDFRTALLTELQKEYVVYHCDNGTDGLRLLQEHHPDSLILNLFMPQMDGIHFMESARHLLPKVVITLSYIYSPYVLKSINMLASAYPILLPCTTYPIKRHLTKMLHPLVSSIPLDKQKIIGQHLNILQIPSGNSYDMLLIGIPLFWQDRTQPLTKELYPAIAQICDCDSWQQVEKAIRDLIHHAWQNRDDTIWKQYFPDTTKSPTNKEFISRLSKFLD